MGFGGAALGVALALKDDDEVIRIADELCTSSEPGSHVALEPGIEHLMQIDVR